MVTAEFVEEKIAPRQSRGFKIYVEGSRPSVSWLAVFCHKDSSAPID